MLVKKIIEAFENKSLEFSWQGHLLGNELKKSKTKEYCYVSVNPSTGSPLLSFQAGSEDYKEAFDAAEKAKATLSHMQLEKKFQLLKKLEIFIFEYQNVLEIAAQVETGRTKRDVKREIELCCNFLSELFQKKDILFETAWLPTGFRKDQKGCFSLDPLGICLSYLPFSSALSTFVLQFTAACLAGCPLVVFTSSHGGLIGSILCTFAREAQIPAGALNIIFAGYDLFRKAAVHPSCSVVFYTGSFEHCAQMMKDKSEHSFRRLILQSGGKNHLLLHESGDKKAAVLGAIKGAFQAAGQLCASTSRMLVPEESLEEVIKMIADCLSAGVIGPAYDQNTEPLMGPVFSKKALERFLRFQTMATREAAQTVHWGRVCELQGNYKDGFYVSPGVHVISKFDPESAYQNNVLFGPDLSIYTYRSLEEAAFITNQPSSQLVMAFYGNSLALEQCKGLFHVPNICLNCSTTDLSPFHPILGRHPYNHQAFMRSGMFLIEQLCEPKSLELG